MAMKGKMHSYPVLIIEDHAITTSLITELLRGNDIPYLFAGEHADAKLMYRSCASRLAFIALDGNLHKHSTIYPDTAPLAEMIRDDKTFKGTVFAMSGVIDHNHIIKKIIGNRCEIIPPDRWDAIKHETIKEIVSRIEKMRHHATHH